MSQGSERCLPFDEDLSALLDRELDAAREAELRAHLAGCAECRTRLAALREVDAELRGLAAPAVRPELAARMAARFAAERGTSPAAAAPSDFRRTPARVARRSLDERLRRRRRLVPLGALSAAAALALALLVLPRVLERTVPAARQGAPPAATEVARREADLAGRRARPPAPPVEIAAEAHKSAAKAPLGAAAADSAPAPAPSDAGLAQLEAASDDELALAIAVQDSHDVESPDDLALVEQLDTVESLDELDRGGHG